jgi:hypothetical protein
LASIVEQFQLAICVYNTFGAEILNMVVLKSLYFKFSALQWLVSAVSAYHFCQLVAQARDALSQNKDLLQ